MKHTPGPWTVKSLDDIGTYYIPECAEINDTTTDVLKSVIKKAKGE